MKINKKGKTLLAKTHQEERHHLKQVFCKLGSVLLSRALRRSIIGATRFHGRVRDGIECLPCAITTKPTKNLYFYRI
jgi:hypothetical protein